MANQQATAATSNTKGGGTLRVKALSRILVGREMRHGETVSEVYREPGDVFDMDREEALRLAGRSFEGYAVERHKNGGTAVTGRAPVPGGVADPIVEIIDAKAP